LKMELAIGVIDGLNQTFSTSVDYFPGTVRVFAPTLQTPADVTELGGKDFTIAFTPVQDDVVYVAYRPIV
jgi:hypothetical protein